MPIQPTRCALPVIDVSVLAWLLWAISLRAPRGGSVPLGLGYN